MRKQNDRYRHAMERLVYAYFPLSLGTSTHYPDDFAHAWIRRGIFSVLGPALQHTIYIGFTHSAIHSIYMYNPLPAVTITRPSLSSSLQIINGSFRYASYLTCGIFILSTLLCSLSAWFLPARRYASAGNSDRNVSVCPSVRHAPVLCQKEES